MPIGSYSAIPTVASEMIKRTPSRVLDLGLGSGMLGATVRQWIDLGVKPWRTFLAGVEIWAGYRNPLWDLYDVIYLRTIQDHLKLDQERYDMVLLGDVIEHFAPPDAEEVLGVVDRLLIPDGCLLVITPAEEMEQGPVYGNPYEAHRSVWTSEKLVQHGFDILLDAGNPQLPPAVPSVVARRTRKSLT
jgi:predicted TPR repeat methyltransferase